MTVKNAVMRRACNSVSPCVSPTWILTHRSCSGTLISLRRETRRAPWRRVFPRASRSWSRSAVPRRNDFTVTQWFPSIMDGLKLISRLLGPRVLAGPVFFYFRLSFFPSCRGSVCSSRHERKWLLTQQLARGVSHTSQTLLFLSFTPFFFCNKRSLLANH